MSRTLLLTRPSKQAKEFAKRVEQNTDFQCHIAPMQKMQDLPADIDFTNVDALVFTSKNGIESFARRWEIRDIPAYCVGPATAEVAKSVGIHVLAASGNSEALTELVSQAGPHNPLHIHGKHKASDLEIAGRSIAIYNQVALTLDAKTIGLLAMGSIDAIALFSPRSARLLADEWQDNWPVPEFVCISKATALPVRNIGKTRVSHAPNAESVLALLQD